MRNKDNPLFDDQCRHAFFLKQENHLRWTRDRSLVNWKEFVPCQVRANKNYSDDYSVSSVTETGMFLLLLLLLLKEVGNAMLVESD